jgi:tryptophanyl-tRNA synthetase
VIEVFGEEKAIRKKNMGIVTDAYTVEAPKDPDVSIIFALYRLFSAEEQRIQWQAVQGRVLGYGSAKSNFSSFSGTISHLSEALRRIADDESYSAEVRRQGALKSREFSAQTMDRVRRLVGVLYRVARGTDACSPALNNRSRMNRCVLPCL